MEAVKETLGMTTSTLMTNSESGKDHEELRSWFLYPRLYQHLKSYLKRRNDNGNRMGSLVGNCVGNIEKTASNVK